VGLRPGQKLENAIRRSRMPFRGALALGYLRAVERYRSLRGDRDRRSDAGGLAPPPARLRVLVAGTADIDLFLSSGAAQAAYLRELLASVGHPLEEMDAVLDFGCGCGRIARWFSDVSRPQLNGCDYNPELVDWCNANLGFISVRKTELEPPLPYADRAFDFVYAFSVFTHLSVELAGRWMAELGRVVKPGGLVWFTIHGDSYRERLSPEETARFNAGEIVVVLPEVEGTNLCGAYWPDSAVASMLGSDFEVLDHFDPKADPITARKALVAHDAYLLRRA
jgi:SAM-dependent methyltransferase